MKSILLAVWIKVLVDGVSAASEEFEETPQQQIDRLTAENADLKTENHYIRGLAFNAAHSARSGIDDEMSQLRHDVEQQKHEMVRLERGWRQCNAKLTGKDNEIQIISDRLRGMEQEVVWMTQKEQDRVQIMESDQSALRNYKAEITDLREKVHVMMFQKRKTKSREKSGNASRCDLCEVTLNSHKVMEEHLRGKRHNEEWQRQNGFIFPMEKDVLRDEQNTIAVMHRDNEVLRGELTEEKRKFPELELKVVELQTANQRLQRQLDDVMTAGLSGTSSPPRAIPVAAMVLGYQAMDQFAERSPVRMSSQQQGNGRVNAAGILDSNKAIVDKDYKTKWCRYQTRWAVERGLTCFHGDKCAFAHSKEELRPWGTGKVAPKPHVDTVVACGVPIAEQL